jgi:hypothetical protein
MCKKKFLLGFQVAELSQNSTVCLSEELLQKCKGRMIAWYQRVAEKNGTGGAMADLPKCAARKIQHATPRGDLTSKNA